MLFPSLSAPGEGNSIGSDGNSVGAGRITKTCFASYMAFVPAPFGGLGIYAVANSEGADKGGALCAAAQQALGQLRGIAARTFKFPTSKKIPKCPTQ